MSGSGNDFILIDNRNNVVDESGLTSFIRNVCRRKMSVGADGLILIENSDSADFKWRYYNSDGGRAEMCGNGARCAARFAYLNKITGKDMSFVTDAGVVGAGLMKRVEAVFEGTGVAIGAVYDKTPPDSSATVVNEVARLFHDTSCDCFVAVGGGSCIDTAKAANIVVVEGTNDLLQFQGAERVTKPLKPFIVVPTTAGTGSEVTLVAVIHDEAKHVKIALTSYRLLPNVAILDPKMTLTMPPKITAATGMDALTHAIEASYCLSSNHYCSMSKGGSPHQIFPYWKLLGIPFSIYSILIKRNKNRDTSRSVSQMQIHNF